MVGYELLADKLSEPTKGSKSKRPQTGNIVPMYRKFEHLNHRVLLHLQDEICEMEEELRYLDECIAQQSPRDETGHAYPASRRGDARYGNEWHYKRTELLGRIFQKLGQYSKSDVSSSYDEACLVHLHIRPCSVGGAEIRDPGPSGYRSEAVN